jgi:hypothetical protein
VITSGVRIPLLLSALLTGFCFLVPIGCRSPDFTNTSLGISKVLIPKGYHGRKKDRGLRPRYITIHSTQNRSSGAGARTQAKLSQRDGLKSKHNSLGYLTWHFTVDDHSAYQSLPTLACDPLFRQKGPRAQKLPSLPPR